MALSSMWDLKGSESFYMESLHLVQFREARRCAGIRGAHRSVTANRNFLTRHRPIKRAGEGRETKHRARLTNETLPQTVATPEVRCPPSGWESPSTLVTRTGEMSTCKNGCRNQLSTTWWFYTLLLPLLLTFIRPQFLWQSIALIGTLLPPAQNSTSFSNMFSIMHQGLSWQA